MGAATAAAVALGVSCSGKDQRPLALDKSSISEAATAISSASWPLPTDNPLFYLNHFACHRAIWTPRVYTVTSPPYKPIN